MEKTKKLAEIQGKILTLKNEVLDMKNTHRTGTGLYEKEQELLKLQAEAKELQKAAKKADKQAPKKDDKKAAEEGVKEDAKEPEEKSEEKKEEKEE
jgi:hypothetical protein